jgi:hypothetical protein
VEVSVPVIVMEPLMLGFVNTSVHFHDQSKRVAIEIGNIGPDRELAAELEAKELTIA